MPLLLDWWMVGVDLESVYYYVWVDSSHILVGPIKAIVVLLEELDECEAEFGAEVHPYLDFVVRVIKMNTYIIEFIYARMIQLQMLSQGRL